MPGYLLWLIPIIAFGFNPEAPRWQAQNSGTTARLRGVCAVSSSVAWASGSNGICLKTIDGGATWRRVVVPGAESLDFRDVEAFDANTAYVLSVGEGERSRIYKTTDGGRIWALQFRNQNPKAFFDAMAFWDSNNGIAVSDPVDGRFVVIRTTDGGAMWRQVPSGVMPPALPGEAAFAASGTCITVQGRNNVWIATGGAAARVFRSTDRGSTWRVATTPIVSGHPSAGIFSIAFKDARNGVVVGGDYTKEPESRDNVATSTDGGRTWKLVTGAIPAGYRSGVAYVRGSGPSMLVTVGPSGSDYSVDGGLSWRNLGTIGYHAVSFAGPTGWAVGEEGRVGKFIRR